MASPIWALVSQRALTQPDAISVIVDGGPRLTYGELRNAAQARPCFTSVIIERGDLGAVDEPGPALFVVTYLATAAMEGCADDLGPVQSRATVRVTGDFAVRAGPGVDAVNSECKLRVVVFMSGSTGTPKSTVHGLDSITSGVWSPCAVADEALHPGRPIRPGDDALLVDLAARMPPGLALCVGLPPRPVGGVSVLNRALAIGDTIVFPEVLTPEAIASAVANHPVTNMGVAPFIAQKIGRLHRSGEVRAATGLLACGIGCAAARREVCADLEEWAPAPVTAAYGTTELGGVALMPRRWDAPDVRWLTVGPSIPGIDVRVGSGESGLLEVRSPAEMRGRRIDTGMLQPAGDDEGNVVVEGRANFVISQGGRRIDPVQIEQALEGRPGVRRAGVLGAPSRVAGEQDVVALVELNATASVAKVRAASLQQLQSLKVARRVIAVRQIPLTSDGKPLRGSLLALIE